MGVDIIAKAKKSAAEADPIEENQALETVTEPTEPAGEPEAKPKRKRTTRKKAETTPAEPQGEAVAASEAAAKPKRKRVTRKKTEVAPTAPESEAAALLEGEHAPEPEHLNSSEEFVPKYDMHSNQRYVDSTSQKTDFEKMLDELSQMSMEALKWDLEKFTKKFGDGDADAMAKKFEAFYGGFITNAAIELYDHGCGDAAFRCLEQAQQVLTAKRKLEEEMAEIKAKQEATAVDLSGLFGM